MADRYADYDSFAWFYNRYWGDLFAGRFLAAIEQLVLSHLPSPARLLDLCCGTGQLAKVLADQGFRVTGVDGSAGMLEFARANAPGGEFVLADARSFTLPGTFHAVLSTFDSLNHVMLLPELTEVFRRVHAVLVEGGRFLFDLNMEEGYRARWRGWEAIVDDDNVCIVRAGYNAEEKGGGDEDTPFCPGGGAWASAAGNGKARREPAPWGRAGRCRRLFTATGGSRSWCPWSRRRCVRPCIRTPG